MAFCYCLLCPQATADARKILAFLERLLEEAAAATGGGLKFSPRRLSGRPARSSWRGPD